MIEFVRQVVALQKQASANLDAWDQAQASYAAGGTLPEVILAYTGTTEAKVDDGATAAVLGALGELRQTAYNAAQILRGTVAIAEGVARQLDGLVETLDAAVVSPLRDVLEEPRGPA